MRSLKMLFYNLNFFLGLILIDVTFLSFPSLHKRLKAILLSSAQKKELVE